MCDKIDFAHMFLLCYYQVYSNVQLKKNTLVYIGKGLNYHNQKRKLKIINVFSGKSGITFKLLYICQWLKKI